MLIEYSTKAEIVKALLAILKELKAIRKVLENNQN